MESLSPTQGTTLTRDWAKCSVCRARKKKCKPSHRDWENLRQRCDYCVDRNLLCGPQYKNSEDPAVTGTAEDESSVVGARSPPVAARWAHGGSQSGSSNPPTGALSGSFGQDGSYHARLPDLAHADQSYHDIDGLSDDECCDKARKSLDIVNALCSTFASRLVPNVHQYSYPSEPFDVMKVEDTIHLEFIKIYHIIARLDGLEKYDRALVFMYALKSALDRYSFLWDARKGALLRKIAQFFQKLGHHWEYEDMLQKIPNMPNATDVPLDKDPAFLLAQSLSQTSALIDRVLASCWRTRTGDDDVPANLSYPSLHRAARLRNGRVLINILTHQYSLEIDPGVSNPQRSPVAEWLDLTQDSRDLIHARFGMNDLDVCRRTALFLAAESGSQNGCLALIYALADPNARDDRMHTILEVAARGGYFDIVQKLLGVGAELEPQLCFNTSSPLQAAIESENYNYQLVQHLLDKGANVNVRRPHDGKNAIDIALEMGHFHLAGIMRDRQQQFLQSPFVVGSVSTFSPVQS